MKRCKHAARHPLGIDRDLLASHLRHKLQEQSLSIRSAAQHIGCSPATLSRLLSGSTVAHQPDTATLAAAAAWLSRSLVDFDATTPSRNSSLAQVEQHLRTLPHFSEAKVRVVMAVVKAIQTLGHRLE